MEYTYLDWYKSKGFNYSLIKYRKEKKSPYVPLEKDIDELIAGFKNSKYVSLLQLLNSKL